jgi:predicted exporter
VSQSAPGQRQRQRQHTSMGLIALVVLGSAVYVSQNLTISTDVSELIGDGDDKAIASLSRAIAQSELSRTIVVAMTARDTLSAIDLSRRFEATLHSNPNTSSAFADIQAGPPTGTDKLIWKLYENSRLGLLASDAAGAKVALSDAGLKTAADALKAELAGPLSPLAARLAPDDPLLILPSIFDGMAALGPANLKPEAGRFIANDRTAIVVLRTVASAFDADGQRPVMAAISAAFESAKAGESPIEATLQISGLARFAIAIEENIRQDILRVSVLSVTGLLLLCWLLFRGFRLVAMSLLPVACGMVFALAVCQAIFGRVHGLTLSFGASLIGVCIDYVVHFYVHQTLDPAADGPHATMRRVRPGLLLGGATTLIGFGALIAASYPGLREVAIFASCGIVGALTVTIVVQPSLVGRAAPNIPRRDRLVGRLYAAFMTLRRNPRSVVGLTATIAAVGLLGLTQVEFDDHIDGAASFPELVAEDTAVASLVGGFERGRFVASVGNDVDEALGVNDRAVQALTAARSAGALGSFRSVAQLLPSPATQRDVARVVFDDPTLTDRFTTAFEAAGFDTSVFQPFIDRVKSKSFQELRWEHFTDTPLAGLLTPFRVDLADGRVAILTWLSEVHHPSVLEAHLDLISGAHLVDQRAIIGGTNRAYRSRLIWLIALGVGLIALLLGARYRSVKRTVAALVPAALASVTTVGILGLLGVKMNLFGLVALLMILSMGVDYGVFLVEVFLVESESETREQSATLLGLLVACLSTVLGFGLLAISSHPAMQLIGLTSAIGVLLSLMLAPIGVALALPRIRS